MSVGNQVASPTILFVDDSATDRTRVAGLLSSERPNWIVVTENDAAAGLDRLSRGGVELVVTDLIMPGMTGEEFLKTIRNVYPSIPVILVTSQGSDEIAARSLELGAVNYVPKRRLAEDLVGAIEEVLRSTHEAAVARLVVSHLVRSRTVFRIGTNLEQIRSLLLLIRERLRNLHALSDEEVRHVTDAVREAMLNAYFHGNLAVNSKPLEHAREEYLRLGELRREDPELAERPIEVELAQEPDAVTFTVTDAGAGFDTTTISQLTQNAGPEADRGHGFRIIQQHMDTIEFNSRGNRVSLTRRLKSGSPE